MTNAMNWHWKYCPVCGSEKIQKEFHQSGKSLSVSCPDCKFKATYLNEGELDLGLSKASE